MFGRRTYGLVRNMFARRVNAYSNGIAMFGKNATIHRRNPIKDMKSNYTVSAPPPVAAQNVELQNIETQNIGKWGNGKFSKFILFLGFGYVSADFAIEMKKNYRLNDATLNYSKISEPNKITKVLHSNAGAVLHFALVASLGGSIVLFSHVLDSLSILALTFGITTTLRAKNDWQIIALLKDSPSENIIEQYKKYIEEENKYYIFSRIRKAMD